MKSFRLKNDSQALGIVIIGAVAVLFGTFSKLILAPNSWTFGASTGDGLKNYFTLLNYVKYDQGLHFTGMNYPYGEYIHYLDGHPILAVILSFIENNVCTIHPYTLSIINYGLLAGYILTPIILYYILRNFSLPRYYCVIVSLIITFLTPQLDRLSSHYSLSHAYLIPLCWLLLIKIYKSSKNRYDLNLLLILLIVLSSWIHTYFAPILGMFVFGLATLMYAFTVQKKWLPIISPLIALAISLFLLNAGDPFIDRETYPWGIYLFTSFWESIFLPNYGQAHDLLHRLVDVRNAPWEGYAFVGLLGAPIFLYLVFFTLKKLFTNNAKRSFFRNRILTYSFVTSILVWIYSTGWIHQIIPEFVQKIIKPLYQFRSMGRFSWVFYYVFTICMAYFIYVQYRKYRSRFPIGSKMILAFLMGIWIWDAYNMVNHIGHKKIHANEILSNHDQAFEQLLSAKGYKIDDFQACMPLPLNMVDTKILFFQHQTWNFRYAVRAAHSTGLPIIGSFAARPSLQHSTALRQIYSAPWIKKQIAEEFDDRPILVIQSFQPKFDYEASLLANCQFIDSTKQFNLYKLDRSYFDQKIDNTTLLSMDTTLSVITSHLRQNEIITLPENSHYVLENYSDQSDHEKFMGNVKEILIQGQEKKMVTVDVDQFKKKEVVDISFWIFMDYNTIKIPEVYMHQLNQSGEIIHTRYINWRTAPNVMGYWVRAHETLELNTATKKLSFEVVDNTCYIDEIMVRPVDTDIIENRNDTLIVNNYPILQ